MGIRFSHSHEAYRADVTCQPTLFGSVWSWTADVTTRDGLVIDVMHGRHATGAQDPADAYAEVLSLAEFVIWRRYPGLPIHG